MELYQIIKAVQAASGSNAKREVLRQHKDNDLLKAYLKAVYDPRINYYQTKLPSAPYGDLSFDAITLQHLGMFSNRYLTGKAAQSWLTEWIECYDKEGQELIGYIIGRDIKANVAEGIILDVFPGLFSTTGF